MITEYGSSAKTNTAPTGRSGGIVEYKGPAQSSSPLTQDPQVVNAMNVFAPGMTSPNFSMSGSTTALPNEASKQASNFGETIARAPIQAGARFGVGLERMLPNIPGIDKSELPLPLNSNGAYQPQGFAKNIFGEDPLATPRQLGTPLIQPYYDLLGLKPNPIYEDIVGSIANAMDAGMVPEKAMLPENPFNLEKVLGSTTGDMAHLTKPLTTLERTTYPSTMKLGDRLMASEGMNHEGRRLFMRQNPNLEFSPGYFEKKTIPVREGASTKLPVQDMNEPTTPVKINGTASPEPTLPPESSGRLSTEPVGATSKRAFSEVGAGAETSNVSSISTAKTVSLEGNIKPSKVSIDLNNKLAKAGVDGVPREQFAGYSNTTKDAQGVAIARELADRVKSDRMALGLEQIPHDILPQALFESVAMRADLEGNHQLTRQLIQSPLASERSRLAQGLGAAGYNTSKSSSLEGMQEVIRHRAEMLSKKVVGGRDVSKLVSSERKAIEKAQTLVGTGEKNVKNSSGALATFIDSITCE